jgi:hypothetical protein
MEPFSCNTLASEILAASTHIDANPSSPPKLESQRRATTPRPMDWTSSAYINRWKQRSVIGMVLTYEATKEISTRVDFPSRLNWAVPAYRTARLSPFLSPLQLTSLWTSSKRSSALR